jgi:hypothetical protein
MAHDLQHASAPDGSGERLIPARDDSHFVRFTDEQFDAMCANFHTTGGIARGDDLARLLEDHPRGAGASLAKLIASDQIFGFDRDGTFWVPMFQFDLDDLRVKPAALKVRAELAAEFDGWEVATWFSQANAYLRDRRPVDLLDSALREVLAAARIDRFIAAR